MAPEGGTAPAEILNGGVAVLAQRGSDRGRGGGHADVSTAHVSKAACGGGRRREARERRQGQWPPGIAQACGTALSQESRWPLGPDSRFRKESRFLTCTTERDRV